MRKVYPRSETPKDSQGRPIYVPAAFQELDQLMYEQVVERRTATASTLNIWDVQLAAPMKLMGGEYWILPDSVANVGANDIIEFSIVDKDDILGLFSTYGLTVGVDVLELAKFVKNETVKKGSSAEGYHTELAKHGRGYYDLIPGLYRRVYYDAVDATGPVEFLTKLYFYV